MNSWKILQVTAGLEEGGVERGTLEMAEYTVDRGAKSLVASSGGKLVHDLESKGARHFCLPLNKRNPASIFYCAAQLVKIIMDYDINLVHARSRAPAWAALLACKYTNIPFITTFHGTHKIQNSFKKFYNSSMVRGVRVIAISRFIKQHIIDNYGIKPEVIDVASRGFSPTEFNPQNITTVEKERLKSSLGISSEEFVITLPGRLTRWKGQVEFIWSLEKLKEFPGWKAILVGGCGKKESYKRELQNLSRKLGLEKRVIFAGSRNDVAQFYSISDIVVSASIEPEAFGRVSVEAQAMKKPVIATAHGGSLETVLDGETGWLITPGDIGALSEVLLNALQGKYDLVKIGEKAREWVSGNFKTEQTCEAEWRSYTKTLSAKSGSRIISDCSN